MPDERQMLQAEYYRLSSIVYGDPPSIVLVASMSDQRLRDLVVLLSRRIQDDEDRNIAAQQAEPCEVPMRPPRKIDPIGVRRDARWINRNPILDDESPWQHDALRDWEDDD